MSTPFATVLLAGGRSTRMKQDKALLHWHGQDLWQAQLHKLQSIGAARVLLSCRREQPLFVSPSEEVEVVHDPEGDPAERDVVVASAQVGSARAQRLPRLSLNGSIGAMRVSSGATSFIR